MTVDNQLSFAGVLDCNICGLPLGDEKVRYHCHITAKYRGTAHIKCYFKLCMHSTKTKVPVVFHNLWGYDGHLIMQAIGKYIECQMISCIPITIENYMTFGVGQLQFIDSQ